jgi:hypothetical protein
MKLLKVLTSAIAFGLVATAPLANAQEKKGGMSPEQYVERVEQAVGTLSKEQKTKIAAIVAKTQESTKALPKEERKEKSGPLQKKQREDVRAVLTSAQQAKFDEAMPAGGKKKN